MTTTAAQPGFFRRLGMAMRLVARGGWGELAYHFDRNATGLRGGPARPYEQVVAVFRCVEFLTAAVAQLPFRVSTSDNMILETGPIAHLLDEPNPRMGAAEFWRQTVGWLLLSEGVHWVFTQRSGSQPTEILPVGSEQMKPRTDRDGQLIGWSYRPAGKQWSEAVSLDLDEVWTIRTNAFDADNPFAGMPVLKVVQRAVNQVYKSDVANESALDNGLEPGGMLLMDGKPTDAQVKNMQAQLRERHAGVQNRKRHLLLHGGMSWQPLAANFADMEFKDLKLHSRDDVCAGFGLDPSAVGFPPSGGRYEYAKAAQDNAWRTRVEPLASWLASEFDRGVLVHFERDVSLTGVRTSINEASKAMGRAQRKYAIRATHARPRRLTAWFDGSRIDANRAVLTATVDTAVKMVQQLKATPAEVNDLLDLGLAGNEAQDQVWVPINEMPYDGASPSDALPTDDEASDGAAGVQASEETRTTEPDPITRAGDEDKLGRLHAAWVRSWSPLKKAAQSRISSHLNDLRREMLRNLENEQQAWPEGSGHTCQVQLVWRDGATDSPQRGSFAMTIEQRDLLGRILFDITAANGRLLTKLRPLVRGGVQLGGDQSVQEAADLTSQTVDPFNLADPNAADALRRRDMAITGINDRAAKRMRAALAEAIGDGKTAEELADVVRAACNTERRRAGLIAYQEVASAVEEGRQLGREQADVPMKSWLSSRRATSRASHVATERHYMAHPIATSASFNIKGTGHWCDYPRSTGDPAHDINCGCTTVSRYPGDGLTKAIDELLDRGFRQATHEHLTMETDQ